MPVVHPIANQTVAPPLTNSTLNPVVVAINDILNKIPLPLWAIYLIAVVGTLLVLLCILCICVKCCCKKKKKKQQQQQKKNEKINMSDVNGKTTSALVQPDVADVDYGSTKKQRGKLLYSLDYNAAQSELNVGIKQADSLMAMDLGGSSDPYVKVYLCPEKSKIFETKVFKSTLTPVFNDHFSFQLSKASLLKSTVVMQVFDFNRFSKHNMIGELRLQLSSVDWNHVIEEWQDLGEAAEFEEEELGEICFSLRYVPSAAKLTIVILEAKNLKSMDIGGSSVFVDSETSSFSMSFELATFRFEATEMIGVPGGRRVNLVISVWDHDAMTRNDAMGKIFLGCDASGNQLRHWADMLSNPRRPVAQWHGLLTAEQVNSTLTLKKKIPLQSKLPFLRDR
ncbi:synaptotagmin VIII [Pseudochaenichthys georgianus]|uniref:synaptotagmin VIII n=1 Tax=Pseudochaenichthys georgianus TaxID=52239 RepID=UPI0039C06AD0